MFFITSVVAPGKQPSPMPADVGECAECGKRNSKRATKCHSCQAILPWARGKVKAATPAVTPAPVIIPAKKASAKPRRDSDEVENFNDDEWWENVAYGVGCLVVGAILYVYLLSQEQARGYIRGRLWTVVLYSLGGKTLVAAVFGGIGLLLIGVGVWRYIQSNKA